MVSNKKIRLLTLLSILFYTSTVFALSNEKKQNNKTIHQQAEMRSIADPNWWRKPVGMSAQFMSKNIATTGKMSASSIATMRTEPLAHFLQLSVDNNWKLISGNIGMASAKYQLSLANHQYELSIIRMNSKVPLSSVLSIWQNKVGIMPQTAFKQTEFKTKRGQQFNLILLKGAKKAIILAVHKGEKYTFFRLLGEQGINNDVVNEFKKLLANSYIIR